VEQLIFGSSRIIIQVLLDCTSQPVKVDKPWKKEGSLRDEKQPDS
jgi:hypothetical protein